MNTNHVSKIENVYKIISVCEQNARTKFVAAVNIRWILINTLHEMKDCYKGKLKVV